MSDFYVDLRDADKVTHFEKYSEFWDNFNKGVDGLYRDGEEWMALSSLSAYWYAKGTLKGRFMIGEDMIMKSAVYRNDYIKFLKEKGIEM